MAKEDHSGVTPVKTTYRYNAGNQLVSLASGGEEQTYAYDRRGNLTAVNRGEELLKAFTFDAANRMTSALQIKDGVEKRAEYSYNVFGNRTGQDLYSREEGAGIPDTGRKEPQDPEQRIRYTLDLTRQYHNLLVSEDSTGQKEQTFYWDGNVAAMEEAGQDSYYLQDDLGSPMLLTDREGVVRESYGFDEFGQDIYHHQEGQLQPFGYTGYQMEAAGGLYFAQARRYDAGVGRFVSEDRVKGNYFIPDNINRFLYCLNQPLIYVDLNGLSREDAHEYMEKYAEADKKEDRNPLFPSYGSNCANFVSQCLFAGGVDMVKWEWFCTNQVNANWVLGKILKLGSWEHRLLGHNVYYNDLDSANDVLLSSIWNSASAQFEYFSNPNNEYINGDVIHVTTLEELEQVSGIQVGDLIYWDWYSDSDGIVNHATIVSKVDDDGTIYFAGNTNSRLDAEVSKYLSEGEIYIVRLNDCVFD